VSFAQLVAYGLVTDTPTWLTDKGRIADAEAAAFRLWGSSLLKEDPEPRPDGDVEESLLPQEDEVLTPNVPIPTMSTMDVLKSTELRRPLIIMLWIFTAQQGSGINAVMYYSNDILGRELPELAAYVSLLVTVVNVLMTFPPIFLIERLGRRFILLSSIFGCVVSTAAMAIGLNTANTLLSSIGVLAFVGSFAVGLGPVPFVIVSEIAPSYAIGSLTSLALSFNWMTNFVIGIAFLPLRNLLSRGTHEGNIFYVFFGILVLSGIGVTRLYR